MLTQTGGTLGAPVDFSQYTDAKHYRIPTSDGSRALLRAADADAARRGHALFAFTSCARFSGRFVRFRGSPSRRAARASTPKASRSAPGETWPLEELMVTSGADRSRLLAQLADRLATHHPPLQGRGAADRLVLVVLLRADASPRSRCSTTWT